jgi:transglutaminase-like putative cysteine protease
MNERKPKGATRYCDIEHPEIAKLASKISNQARSERDTALRCFLSLRDGVRFGIDLVRRRASETLSQGYGACYNKSLLLTALLRACGIEAELGTIPLHRTFIRPYVGLNYLLINSPFHHGLTRVRLGGTWMWVEPTLDRPTYEALFRPMDVRWGIDWDGETDADFLYQEHVLGPPRVCEDIDHAIGTNLGNRLLPDPLAAAWNRRINRRAWRRLHSASKPSEKKSVAAVSDRCHSGS